MPAKLITPPTLEPVTLQEAKDHLRVTTTDEDALISELITSARQQAETFLRRALLTQTWALYLDSFPDQIELPNSPVQSVTSIKYIDVDGVEQTLSTLQYDVHTQNEPALIVPAYGKTWPSIRSQLNAITVEFVAGWQIQQSVPGPIKSALLLIIGHLYENRENASPLNMHQLPYGANALLFPYRIIRF